MKNEQESFLRLLIMCLGEFYYRRNLDINCSTVLNNNNYKNSLCTNIEGVIYCENEFVSGINLQLKSDAVININFLAVLPVKHICRYVQRGITRTSHNFVNCELVAGARTYLPRRSPSKQCAMVRGPGLRWSTSCAIYIRVCVRTIIMEKRYETVLCLFISDY